MVSPPKAEMVQHHAAGRLLQEICTNYGWLTGPDRDEAVAVMAELHNTGQINLLAPLLGSDLRTLGGPELHRVQWFYCVLIPRLSAPAAQTLAAAHALRVASAPNSSAYFLDKAFADWCTAHGDRLDEVIAHVRGAATLVDAFMWPALAAGISLDECRYLDQALALLEADDPGPQLSALRAISFSAPKAEAAVAKVLSALASVLDRNADDRMRASTLTTALEVAARSLRGAPDALLVIVRAVAVDPGPEALRACADALAHRTEILADEAVEILLQALRRTDPAHALTLDIIDAAFIRLLGLGQEERVMTLAEHLLVANEGKLTLGRFGSLHHTLMTGDEQRLGRTLVRFFMGGKFSLCEAAASLIQGSHDRPVVLDIDFAAIRPSHGQALYLARKAIGFWFVQPVTAASFIVSLLRHAPDATVGELCALLLDPLLLSYGGGTRDYLEQVAGDASDRAARHVGPVLAEHGRYLEHLRSVGEIPELYPSERQRRIEHEREFDRMAAAMKEAQKGSVIRQLMRTSILLYGTRSISHVDDPDGTTRRLDTKLGSIGTTMEHPRMRAIDPVGLDFTFGMFRLEAPPR